MPGSAPCRGGWAAPVAATRVDGRRLDTVSHRFWQTRQEHLLVGNDGVSWVHDASATVLTVDYARCTVLVVEGPQLTLFGENGTSIIVHRDYWRGGDIAVRDIQALVAAGRIIRIEPPAETAP
jgi:hypothetical protein